MYHDPSQVDPWEGRTEFRAYANDLLESSCRLPIQPTPGTADGRSRLNEGNVTGADRCPSCGSGTLVLQGRMFDGKMIGELVCVSCKHAWRVDLPEFHRRLRP